MELHHEPTDCTESCVECPKQLDGQVECQVGPYVCRCLRVTEETVVTSIRILSLTTVREIRDKTGAGDGCTACHRRIQRLIDDQASSSALAICSVK